MNRAFFNQKFRGTDMIKRIIIQSFRSIEKIDFDFEKEEKNIVCLLGKNGSGKSNIFKAIDYYFRHIDKLYSDEKIIDNSNPYIQKSIISIVFDIGLLRKKATQNQWLDDKFKIIEYYLSKKTKNHLSPITKIELTMTQFRDGTIKWSIEDASIRSTIKSLFPMYYIDTRRLDLYTWDKLWTIISDLSVTKSSDDYKTILDEAFDNIWGKKYISSKEIIEQTFEKSRISLDKYHFEDRYKNAFSMRFGGDQFMVDGYPLDYYSDGSSSFIYLKLLTILIPKISELSCKFPIILIDEPEIGLHNELITNFVDCLYNSIKQKVFCMISTHSPKLIADLSNYGSNYCIYRVNKKGFNSVINKMNVSWLNDSKHKVTIRETECYFSDFLVYVEGETEMQLFSHPKILELFSKLKKVHFYSFDSNDVRLRTVHSKKLNLGIPYKIIIDMDKVIQYDSKKSKFSIRSESLVNPLSNDELKKSEQFRYYSTKKTDIVGERALIKKLIKNNDYTLVPGKNYIQDRDFNNLMETIIHFCDLYNVIVNWSTIEGDLITVENIDEFLNFKTDQKEIKNKKQYNNICSQPDLQEKMVLMLGGYEGKTETFCKPKIFCEQNNNPNPVQKEYDKTSGWIERWLNYFFANKIDGLETTDKKRKEFKKYFPRLYSTLQIIENMI